MAKPDEYLRLVFPVSIRTLGCRIVSLFGIGG